MRDPRPRPRADAQPPPRPRRLLARLLDFTDRDATVQRLRRNALVATVLLAIGTAIATGSGRKVLGMIAASALILLNFQWLIAATGHLLEDDKHALNPLQMALVAGRHVLLALGLCGIVLMPGVGPIPVAIALAVVVFAVLLEAIVQLFTGGQRSP